MALNDICDIMILPLVPDGAVTDRSVKNGRWSDPATWQSGKLPAAGANVLIALNTEVVFDLPDSPAYRTIRVDGMLGLDVSRDTNLNVDTLVVPDGGTLSTNIRAASSPSGHTRITFTDSGPIDTVWDPYVISRGLLCLDTATVNLVGPCRTPYGKCSQSISKGATTLILDAAPGGWQVGDDLALTGTQTGQDELLSLLAVSGAAITFRPLNFNHTLPAAGLSLYVANLTRSVELRSVGKEAMPAARRGHVMFCGENVDVHNVAFWSLGRTDKRVPINDPKVVNGVLTAGTGTNPRARYACHFHLAGTDQSRPPGFVSGSVARNSLGWGFVNHRSYAVYASNVSYDCLGAGFVTEAGDEIGSFLGNLAIKETGSGQLPDARPIALQDFGHDGVGFWFQGFGFTVEDNIACGAAHTGYQWWGQGLILPDGSVVQYQSANLPDPSLAKGAPTVNVESVPLGLCSNNEAFACGSYGIFQRYLQVRPLAAGLRSTMSSPRVWNIAAGGNGILFHYNSYLTVQDGWIYSKDLSGSIGIAEGNEQQTGNQYLNNHIEGWRVGILTAQAGHTEIHGGTLMNLVNVTVPEPYAPNVESVLVGYDVAFSAPSAVVLAGRTPWDIQEPFDFASTVQGYGPPAIFAPNTILLGSSQVYPPEQATTFVPFPSAASWSKGMPPGIVGLTNGQLWAGYGIAVGGVLPPQGSAPVAGISGTVGALAAYPPWLTLISSAKPDHTKPYQLIYRLPDQTIVKDPVLATLTLGWNIITRTVAGMTRSWFVNAT